MCLKRAFDILSSTIGLVVLSPLLVAIAVWIKMDSSGPVFFRGLRVGLHGKPFRIYKFRTMIVDAEKIGGASASSSDPRITRVGKILRGSKLDELPQLINVLNGDMSVVGPRPEVKRYVEMYGEREMAILTVRPGITDWASLANPDEGAVLAGYDDPDRAYEEIIRPEKLKLQLKYVRERNFAMDLSIVFKTIKAVLMR